RLLRKRPDAVALLAGRRGERGLLVSPGGCVERKEREDGHSGAHLEVRAEVLRDPGLGREVDVRRRDRLGEIDVVRRSTRRLEAPPSRIDRRSEEEPGAEAEGERQILSETDPGARPEADAAQAERLVRRARVRRKPSRIELRRTPA